MWTRERRLSTLLVLALITVVVWSAFVLKLPARRPVTQLPPALGLGFQVSLTNLARDVATPVSATNIANGAAMPVTMPANVSARAGVSLVPWVFNDGVVGLIRGGGGKKVRQTLWWSDIEPIFTSPPSYNWANRWANYDVVFEALGRSGIDTHAVVGRNPAWAASKQCGPIDSPAGLSGFARFLSATVRRYSQPPYNVRNWELLNEPDSNNDVNNPNLGVACFGKYPDDYVELLRVAWDAIKAADPAAVILMGGLAFEPYEGEDGYNVNFLSQVLQAGGGNYFDVANVHYYSSQYPYWSSFGPDLAAKVNRVRATMAQYGVSKPVAVTEVSWTNSADPAQQAEYVSKVIPRAQALDLFALTWYSLNDYDGADFPYGLADRNLSARPAFAAFKAAMGELGSGRFVSRLDASDAGSAGGIEGYSFNVEGQSRWVLWTSAAGAHVELPLWGQTSVAKNYLGQVVASSNISATISVGNSPIYVEVSP